VKFRQVRAKNLANLSESPYNHREMGFLKLLDYGLPVEYE